MKKLTTDEFIQKAKKVHGDRYDYSLTKYILAKTKIKIICLVHGIFLQSPDKHLLGNGCKKCSIEKIHKFQTYSDDKFIELANDIHKNKYDYSKINYLNNTIKIEIICLKHGKFFQLPSNHLQGHGCNKCVKETMAEKYKLNQNDFIDRSIKIHKNKYNYSCVNYKNNYTKIDIICPKHGTFSQTPNSHLHGNGCPICSSIISKLEIEFLNKLGIPLFFRQVKINKFKVDGYDPKTNTIYEFLGDYWHGNPYTYHPNSIHPKRKIKFSELYNETIQKFKFLYKLNYKINYIWERDWNSWNKMDKLSLKEYTGQDII